MNTTAILQDIETFLYTPYGLATLAATAVILTSFVWFIACCIFCCCWKCHKRQVTAEIGGSIEAGNDLKYIQHRSTGDNIMHTTRPITGQGYSTTNSSGYQSGIDTLNYSTSSLQNHDVLATNTSMDSILNHY